MTSRDVQEFGRPKGCLAQENKPGCLTSLARDEDHNQALQRKSCERDWNVIFADG